MRRVGRLLFIAVLAVATVVVMIEHGRATERRLQAEAARDEMRAWLASAASDVEG